MTDTEHEDKPATTEAPDLRTLLIDMLEGHERNNMSSARVIALLRFALRLDDEEPTFEPESGDPRWDLLGLPADATPLRKIAAAQSLVDQAVTEAHEAGIHAPLITWTQKYLRRETEFDLDRWGEALATMSPDEQATASASARSVWERP